MSAPYGSLMRYLFPALLLHGECGTGRDRVGCPRGDDSRFARKAGGVASGPHDLAGGGRGSRVGALSWVWMLGPGCSDRASRRGKVRTDAEASRDRFWSA